MAELVVLVLLVVLTATVFGLGYWSGRDTVDSERHELAAQREALDSEWQALQQAQRVSDVFYRARQAMRDALRPGDGRQS